MAIFLSILFAWPVPLLPTQILWVNLITDSLPAIALGIDPGDKDVMKKKPRDPEESFFAEGAGLRAIIGGLLIGLLTLAVFYYGLGDYGYSTGFSKIPADALSHARTMSFVVLALSQLFYSLSIRNSSKSIWRIGVFSNKYLIAAILLGAVLQFGLISVPFLARAFNLYSLSLQDWSLLLVLALIPMLVNELIKIIIKYKNGVSTQ